MNRMMSITIPTPLPVVALLLSAEALITMIESG